jgi:hypothetical protein
LPDVAAKLPARRVPGGRQYDQKCAAPTCAARESGAHEPVRLAHAERLPGTTDFECFATAARDAETLIFSVFAQPVTIY